MVLADDRRPTPEANPQIAPSLQGGQASLRAGWGCEPASLEKLDNRAMRRAESGKHNPAIVPEILDLGSEILDLRSWILDLRRDIFQAVADAANCGDLGSSLI
jgi:hypothetical protein